MAKRYKASMLNVNGSPVPALVGKSAYDFAKDGGYNGNEESFSKKLSEEAPKKTSQMENDSGFVTTAIVESRIADTLKCIYPVGAIYISASEVNPSQIFKFGEWQQIKDRFLLSVGDSHVAGETGGEEKHQLTSSELPKLGGYFAMHGTANATGTVLHQVGDIQGYSKLLSAYGEANSTRKDGGTTVNDAGSIDGVAIQFGDNQPHNNMPPYLAVYVWKRIS